MGLFSGGGWMAALNPMVALGAGTELYGDYEAKMAAKAADSTTREMNAFQMQLARDQMQMQKEFAQHGIRWKAEDAAAAGLHPLAALGASGASYSPVMAQLEAPQAEARSRGEMFRSMGQNLTRAAMAMTTPEEKAYKALQIERMGLENEILRRDLGSGSKGLPSASVDPMLQGQGDVWRGVGADARVIDTPLNRVVHDPRDVSKEAGAYTDWQMVRTRKGYAVVPAQQTKQAIEDSPMEYQWLLRAATRSYVLPDGREAVMNPLTGNLIPKKDIPRKLDELMFGPGGHRGAWRRLRYGK